MPPIPLRSHLLCGLLFAALAVPAAAQAAAPAAPGAAPAAAPAADAGFWSLSDENASVSLGRVTDRYYVNGLHLAWTSPRSAVPAGLANISRQLWADPNTRVSIALDQQIFTPYATSVAVPPPGDRPYAGILMATLGLMSETSGHRSTFSLGLGVVGPSALGKQIQNGFHDLIGQGHNAGWDSQLRDEPAIQLTSSRVWRAPIGRLAGLETDLLPQFTVGLGTLRIYADSGITIRIGQGLATDFGPFRQQPGLSGGDVFTPVRAFSWYGFVGADGMAIAQDVTLDGNTWRSSAHVQRQPFVGEVSAGFAVIAYGMRLSYTQIVQTETFRHQKGGLHESGLLALTLRF